MLTPGSTVRTGPVPVSEPSTLVPCDVRIQGLHTVVSSMFLVMSGGRTQFVWVPASPGPASEEPSGPASFVEPVGQEQPRPYTTSPAARHSKYRNRDIEAPYVDRGATLVGPPREGSNDARP